LICGEPVKKKPLTMFCCVGSSEHVCCMYVDSVIHQHSEAARLSQFEPAAHNTIALLLSTVVGCVDLLQMTATHDLCCCN